VRTTRRSLQPSLSHPWVEMETFDEVLDRQIWSLADTRLKWHKRLAHQRRTVPGEIEEMVSQLLEEHRFIDEDKGTTDIVDEVDDDDDDNGEPSDCPPQDRAHISQCWNRRNCPRLSE